LKYINLLLQQLQHPKFALAKTMKILEGKTAQSVTPPLFLAVVKCCILMFLLLHVNIQQFMRFKEIWQHISCEKKMLKLKLYPGPHLKVQIKLYFLYKSLLMSKHGQVSNTRKHISPKLLYTRGEPMPLPRFEDIFYAFMYLRLVMQWMICCLSV
jgi:hypothetical protein